MRSALVRHGQVPGLMPLVLAYIPEPAITVNVAGIDCNMTSVIGQLVQLESGDVVIVP